MMVGTYYSKYLSSVGKEKKKVHAEYHPYQKTVPTTSYIPTTLSYLFTYLSLLFSHFSSLTSILSPRSGSAS